MSIESELRRLRSESNRHRSDIANASAIVAAQRKKAAEARIAAGKSKSPATIRSKLAEEMRATTAANAAEKKRAESEKKLANIDSKVHSTQEKYEKEQRAANIKATNRLRQEAENAAVQFHAPSMIGGSASIATSSSASSSDIFLSHASEDKDDIARPLKEALESRGVSVWFDELKIKVGQSIRQEIEKGIASCRYGVVIVSPDFFRKQWTQAELDALFSKKMDSGENLILPVWHRVSKDEVLEHSPLLAGILALNSSLNTVDEMAEQLEEVVRSLDKY